MRVGPGVSDPDMGPIISKRQLETIERYVQVGTSEGARVAAGGARPAGAALGRGFYFQPTLLDAVTPDMRVAREEIFGPVLAITDFDDLEEAVAFANRSDYGLVAASGRATSTKRWRSRRASEADRCTSTPTAPAAAWNCRSVATRRAATGGRKGLESLASYTQVKNVCIKYLSAGRRK